MALAMKQIANPVPERNIPVTDQHFSGKFMNGEALALRKRVRARNGDNEPAFAQLTAGQVGMDIEQHAAHAKSTCCVKTA